MNARVTRHVFAALVLLGAARLHAQQAPVVPVTPAGNRYVHPAIAPPAAGAVCNGAAPLFQYADGAWNHGEGFLPAGAIDDGGWFDHDDGTNVDSSDVHTPFGWQNFDWFHPTHPLGDGSGAQMKRLYGFLRPAAAGALPTSHPLYGDLTGSVGPFAGVPSQFPLLNPARSYVDQGAFEIFRPTFSPADGQKVVIVINTRQTTAFPANKDGDSLSWRQVYMGFFSPDGLIRTEAVTGSASAFMNNDDVYDVMRPDPIVVARAVSTGSYYPIFAYAVPSVMHRETELNEQRDLQLVQAIKEILMEDPMYGRNPFDSKLTPTQLKADVYVVFAGGSNGGMQASWAAMRHPEIVHGNLSGAISPSMQRLIGEFDMSHAVGRLSGQGPGFSEVGERDLLHWGHYAWNQGYWVHDLSMAQRYLRGELHRPCLFAVGDEDITGTGTDWIRLISGGAWSRTGVQNGLSALGDQSYNRFAWTAAENGCHGEAKFVNAYDATTEFFSGELVLDLIPDVIGQQNAVGSTSIPVVSSTPRSPAQELRGLDDPHEWALGRIGAPMTAGAGLTRDDEWFDETQPGAAGTMLGYKEAMLIRDGALFVGGAEGVVTRFVVDPTTKALVKQAHSNPGDGSPTLPLGTPMALGHEAFAMTAVEDQSGWSLVVGTRRHLHVLDPANLTVASSVQVPWEIARPRHLKVGNVLPDSISPGEEVIFCSQLGGLVFYDRSLVPVWEWPEPGIVDFHVAGSEVAILSHRGVVARVEFTLGASGPEARLLGSSKPIPQPGEFASVFCQGDPVDLERMQLDWSFWGAGNTPQYVSAWNNDGDGGGVRIHGGPGLALVPMAGQFGKISDIATTNQPAGYLGNQDGIGDHLLVLSGTRLRLLDQTGSLKGEVDLNKREAPGGGAPLDYSFGNHAISLAVGELYNPGGGFSYTEEVVVGTHSGALVWLHVEELVGALHPLPSPEFDPVLGSGVQPRTNQNLSATWAVSKRLASDDLHCLDRRGAYWVLSDTGMAFQDNHERGIDAVGWDDAENRVGAVSIPFSASLLPSSSLQVGVTGNLNLVASHPWAPIVSPSVFYEASSMWLPYNWTDDTLLNSLFHGFVVHKRPGYLVDVASGVKQCWYWSGRGSAVGTVGDWGNVVEAYELSLTTDTIDAYWASVGEWPGMTAACPHLDLRSFTTQHPVMNEQSVRVSVLSDGSLAVFLGCPGGMVRCVRGVDMLTPQSSPHAIGVAQSSPDLGFGGGALAIRADANDVVTIWFGTTANPAKRPQSSVATGALADDEVVTGALHCMTWSPTTQFSATVTTKVLSPGFPGAPRGGYGVVGIAVGNVLGDSTSPDEVVVGTISGEILVLDQSLATVLWRANVPGAAGCFNAIHVADLDTDGVSELYVSGSFGIWRFNQ